MTFKKDINLRSKVIYQVFPRQYSKDHDFKGIIKDLDRIANMGVDIIYLLPIHPIGFSHRKGSVGSPYAIMDYMAIHEDLGTFDDFLTFVKETRKRHMKVMMDIVFNHTSKDAILTKSRPSWFHKNEHGALINRVGDWSDIADLNFDKKPVWNYLIDVLSYWAQFVDGFRCDVAPLIPIEFWIKARKEISKKHPNLIWLSESVEPEFISHLKERGFICHTDLEMYQAFDICYDYDIYKYMDAYLSDPKQLKTWLDAVMEQERKYPTDYIKLRSFENHDQKRLRSKVRDEAHFIQMIALNFFLKGPTLIYAGEEHQANQQPSLFEYDPIRWEKNLSIEPLIKKLSNIKHQSIFSEGYFQIHHKTDVAVMSYQDLEKVIIGIFNLENLDIVHVPIKDGIYKNLLFHNDVHVKHGIMELSHHPIIIETTKGHLL